MTIEAGNTAYELADLYLRDSTIETELRKRLVKAIRTRDLPVLARASTLGTEQHPESWLILRQVEAFFKKNVAFSDPKRCRKAAIASFARSETQCRITNRRLQYYLVDHPERMDIKLRGQVERMRSALSTLHGDYADFRAKMPDLVRVTNGATCDRGRIRSLPFLKFSAKLRGPKGAYGDILDVIDAKCGTFIRDLVRFIPTNHNRVEFVEKNWTTYRTIACEATASLPLQLAYDAYMKTRLITWGIDLSSQSRNQELARQGSIDGSTATVDLERASDTTAFLCVMLLFPALFAAYLNRVRASEWSSRYMPSGTYAKFSSMGNGSTFCIETAIFAAAVYAVGSSTLCVYGDDIVCDTSCVPDLRRLLRFLGYSFNAAKSYYGVRDLRKPITGSHVFRESCGTDWLNGRLVTPFYLRSEPGCTADWHHVINGLVKVSRPHGHVWQYLRNKLAGCSHLVPLSDDTRAGIHVDRATLAGRGFLRTKEGITRYWAMSPTLASDLEPAERKWGNGFISASEHRAPAPDCTREFTRISTGRRALDAWFFASGPSISVRDSYPLASFRSMRHDLLVLSLRSDAMSDVRDTGSTTRLDIGEPLYSAQMRLYVPPLGTEPSYLVLWSEFIGPWDPRATRAAKKNQVPPQTAPVNPWNGCKAPTEPAAANPKPNPWAKCSVPPPSIPRTPEPWANCAVPNVDRFDEESTVRYIRERSVRALKEMHAAFEALLKQR